MIYQVDALQLCRFLEGGWICLYISKTIWYQTNHFGGELQFPFRIGGFPSKMIFYVVFKSCGLMLFWSRCAVVFWQCFLLCYDILFAEIYNCYVVISNKLLYFVNVFNCFVVYSMMFSYFVLVSVSFGQIVIVYDKNIVIVIVIFFSIHMWIL